MDNKTQEILEYFGQISAIPRCSGNEAALCAWLQAWASKHGFSSKVDEAGNICISVPASKGSEHAATVVLQGHMDMVCEKAPESKHDFTKDAISNVIDGEWMTADHTTLGSDNGIAIAFAMAAAADPLGKHPPLELLFTVKEEVGLSGVNFLKPGFITGKTLINIDSEEEGTFIVGCAGGETTFLNLPITLEANPSDEVFEISIDGCRGGHSGVDIAKNFANANKLLARGLTALETLGEIRISQISGGTAHNAIPRSAKVTVILPNGSRAKAEHLLNGLLQNALVEHKSSESNISISLKPASASTTLSATSTASLIRLLNSLPSGVINMSPDMPDFVETSCNLARVEQNDNTVRIVTSQRGTSMSRLKEITSRIYSIGQLAGAVVTTESSYPSWNPDLASPLLGVFREAFTGLFGQAPKVESIHAGLECSAIGDIYPGIDMISIGVTIENPHSPTERMHLPSIPKVWQLLTVALQKLA